MHRINSKRFKILSGALTEVKCKTFCRFRLHGNFNGLSGDAEQVTRQLEVEADRICAGAQVSLKVCASRALVQEKSLLISIVDEQ